MKIKLAWVGIIALIMVGIFFIFTNYEVQDDVIKFGFTNLPVEFHDEIVFVSGEELEGYDFSFDIYNSGVFYSSLNDTEKQIYQAYRYAFENSYQYILIDNRLQTFTERSFETMLYFLTFDSPLVEQNIRVVKGSIVRHIDGPFGQNIEYEMTMHEIDIFTKEKNELKQAAIEKSKEILSCIPNGLSEYQKASWLYRYLGENVIYDDSLPREESNYLYDTIITKRTQCDGFANSYSLLLNMLGIPCFEKINEAPEGAEGHTWNSFKVDGVWYNADVTAYYQLVSYNCPVDMFFGYSDDLQTTQNLYSEIIPACNRVLELSCSFENEKDSSLVNKIAAAYNHEKGYVTFKFEEKLTDAQSIIAMIVGYLGSDNSYIAIDNRYFCIYRR